MINLIIEDILDDGPTPTSFKRTLSSNSNVAYDDVLILSGIKKEKIVKSDYSVPYLSNIPFLGAVFQYKTNSKDDTRITIAIQVLRDIDDVGGARPTTFELEKNSRACDAPCQFNKSLQTFKIK